MSDGAKVIMVEVGPRDLIAMLFSMASMLIDLKHDPRKARMVPDDPDVIMSAMFEALSMEREGKSESGEALKKEILRAAADAIKKASAK